MILYIIPLSLCGYTLFFHSFQECLTPFGASRVELSHWRYTLYFYILSQIHVVCWLPTHIIFQFAQYFLHSHFHTIIGCRHSGGSLLSMLSSCVPNHVPLCPQPCPLEPLTDAVFLSQLQLGLEFWCLGHFYGSL